MPDASRPEVVLGVSADYHDAAAALLVDGEVVAAVQEERLTRRKHDPDLPVRDIADARSMRALAHPLRLRLLEYLALRGPLTATQCAELVGESPASCSFHLRQLAKYGFVEAGPASVGMDYTVREAR